MVALLCVAIVSLCLRLAHVGGPSGSIGGLSLDLVGRAAVGGAVGGAFMLVAERVRQARQAR